MVKTSGPASAKVDLSWSDAAWLAGAEAVYRPILGTKWSSDRKRRGQVRGQWAGLVRALANAGWRGFKTADVALRAQCCRPLEGNKGKSCRAAPCPFCWGRRVSDVFRRIAVFADDNHLCLDTVRLTTPVSATSVATWESQEFWSARRKAHAAGPAAIDRSLRMLPGVWGGWWLWQAWATETTLTACRTFLVLRRTDAPVDWPSVLPVAAGQTMKPRSEPMIDARRIAWAVGKAAAYGRDQLSGPPGRLATLLEKFHKRRRVGLLWPWSSTPGSPAERLSRPGRPAAVSAAELAAAPSAAVENVFDGVPFDRDDPFNTGRPPLPPDPVADAYRGRGHPGEFREDDEFR